MVGIPSRYVELLAEEDRVVRLHAAELPRKRHGKLDIVVVFRRTFGDDPEILVLDVV